MMEAEPTTTAEAAPPAFPLTTEELAAGSARFEVHEVSEAASFPPRDHRVVAEVTTPETEPERVVEALMRAAFSVHRENGLPFAVMVRLWDAWPNSDTFANRVEVYPSTDAGGRPILRAARSGARVQSGRSSGTNSPHGYSAPPPTSLRIRARTVGHSISGSAPRPTGRGSILAAGCQV